MANQCNSKFLSTTHDSYRHPYRDQPDYKYFFPQSCHSSITAYRPDKGTLKWFQDYRRTNTEEQTLNKNLQSFSSSIRPTKYSDKPDIALGARKQDRELLFPVIQNNPVYLLTNINPDQIRDRDVGYMDKVKAHRKQIKDLTGSEHKKVDFFYFPSPSSETFIKRNVSDHYITEFPSHHTAANDFITRKNRAAALVDYNKTDVTR